MGTHLVGRRGTGARLLLVALAALAALTATAANARPAAALGNPILLTITVSPTVASVDKGETQQFTATGHYSNLTTQNLTDTATWSSSSTTVATESSASGSQGLATAVGTGLATIMAVDGSVTGTAAMTVLPAVLLAVTVAPTVASIPLGESEPFAATGHYSDGSTQNLTDSVTWSTSSSSVATVSNASGSEGSVTAAGTGLATIGATDPSTSIEGTAAVTVLPAALLLVTVSPLVANIPAGETEQFTATGHYSNGTTSNITDSVTWGTSSSAAATVSNVAGTQGEVTAVATGAATISATDHTTSIEGTAAVTVLPAVLLVVTVSPLVANIPAGESEPFTATGHYSDGSTQNLTDSVTWASSDSGTATVSNASGAQGEVTAVADGATTITATDPTTSIEGISAVTVLPAVLLAITVSPLAANIPAGETEQFTATGHYSDLSTQDLTDSVTWSSSDTSEATISNNAGSEGVATGAATGDVVITATDPTSGVFGVADLDVGGLKLTISPSIGPPRTHVTVSGEGFTPGSTLKIIYKTGDSTKPSFKICTATVAPDGTFSCTGHIRGTRVAGSPGSHTVNAKVPHTHTVTASTTYTLTS